ncbi:MAG: hypothetical protein KJP08_08305 [Gammaproteobacteria bacterium]|nr:hypothetical protein [Gammaproteobacteria bacterium]NNF49308.1 hypothetical protein [Woeseiaceae bacterium]MBT8094798.1 hypothetical protein [Gammaproteobacteria bacterium]MBT8105970.1 hypothetical protein [Gammaproteobacteria bacterium]NNK25983.1 hypothetical protein [Woeseiaceae bacterium]
MLTGRDALKRMDKTLFGARRNLDRLDIELQATSRSLSGNKLEQARAIDRMARIRLDAARGGEVVGHLESATHKAMGILDARDGLLAALNDRAQAARESIEQAESRREALHDEVDAAAQALAECEAAAQRSLEQDATFLAQLEQTQDADAVAVSALEKAELAAEDRSRKGEAFESDELFIYLWRRGYGTSAYKANPLARLLDAWVARLCKYHDARPNYWMLNEIPKRLAEHANHARDAADTEVDKLQDIEERVAQDRGVPDARARLEALEQRQDELDEDIAAAEAALGELRAEQGRFAAGEDDNLLKAIRVISAAMETRNISDLTRIARGTMTAEDDAIIEELRQLRQQYDEFEDELRETHELQNERLARIRELENVRRDFKRNRYDDLHSRFDKSDAIQRMIQEVIGGVIRGGALWNMLRRYQSYIDAAGEWPDFGSGGILRPGSRRRRKKPSRPPTWHWPGPARRSGGSRGGFKIPRRSGGGGGRSRSRGGFRTGGGA